MKKISGYFPVFSFIMASKCGCSIHNQLTSSVSAKDIHTFKLSSRKFVKSIIESLVRDGLLSKRATYLCTVCAEHVSCEPDRKKPKIDSVGASNDNECTDIPMPSTDTTNITHTNIDIIPPNDSNCNETQRKVKSIVSDIENGVFSREQLGEIASALGKSQHAIAYKITKQCSSLCDNLYKIDANDVLACGNEVALEFLCGFTGYHLPVAPTDVKECLALGLEHIYHCRDRHFIGPLSFKRAIEIYFTSKSKTSCSILSKAAPFPSYQTLLTWLSNQGKDPLMCPNGDTITFFDNNQIIGKTHNVKLNQTVKSSVVTTLIHISSPLTSHYLQMQEALSPKVWLKSFELSDANKEQLVTIEEKSQYVFR